MKSFDGNSQELQSPPAADWNQVELEPIVLPRTDASPWGGGGGGIKSKKSRSQKELIIPCL